MNIPTHFWVKFRGENMNDLKKVYKKIDETIEKAKIKDSDPEVVSALKRAKEETDAVAKKKTCKKKAK